MNPTTPTLADGDRAELRAEAERTPEWAGWLALIETALAAGDDTAWRDAAIRFAAARPADAPLLEGARLGVDVAAAGALVTALLERVSPDRPAAGSPDPLALLAAAIAGDRDRLAALADGAGLEAGVLATVAELAARPVLMEVARRAAPLVPAGWAEGWCPVCGDWPALAELEGLERARVLRCGRCATGWPRAALYCVYCGERDHRRQGALVPEEGGERLRIETCAACGGYLKVMTTLRLRSPAALALADLRSLPLEMRARERGCRRPDGSARPPAVAVSPRGAVAAGGGP